jgi:hypothetical protein
MVCYVLDISSISGRVLRPTTTLKEDGTLKLTGPKLIFPIVAA